jgi:hypothetical protein
MNPPDARPAAGNSRRTAAAVSFAAFLLAIVLVAACRQVTGVSLGLFFGGAGAATLIVPPLVATQSRGFRWGLVPAATTLGAAIAWTFAPADALTWGQWLGCSLVLMAYGIALGGIVAVAISQRAPLSLAASVATILGLLWLTWPVWLSHALLTRAGDRLVAWLVPAHPLFAINGVLVHFDSWDRLPLAYTQLSNLNQDVFYTLPSSVVPTVLVHLLIGIIFGGLAMLIERHRRRQQLMSPAAAAAAAKVPAGGAPVGR